MVAVISHRHIPPNEIKPAIITIVLLDKPTTRNILTLNFKWKHYRLIKNITPAYLDADASCLSLISIAHYLWYTKLSLEIMEEAKPEYRIVSSRLVSSRRISAYIYFLIIIDDWFNPKSISERCLNMLSWENLWT